MSPINIEEIKVVVEGDTKDLSKDLEKVKQQLKDLDKLVKATEKSVSAMSKVFKNINTTAFANGIKQASTSLDTATKNADKLNSTINKSANNINNANSSAQRLANTLTNISDVNVNVSQGGGSSAGLGLAAGALGAGVATSMSQPLAAAAQLRQQAELVKSSWQNTKEMMASMGAAIRVAAMEEEKLLSKVKAVKDAIVITVKESGFGALGNDIRKYGNELVKAEKQQKALKREMDNTSKSAKTFSTSIKGIIAALGGLAIGKGILASIGAEMNRAESENLFAVSFGQYTEEMRAFTSNAVNDFAMVQSEAMSVAGSFNFMIANITKNKEQAKEMSKELLQMTVDFSSLFNVTTERSQELIRGALTGEAEGLKQFGIIINDATIKQYAYANGIAASGAELSENQKLLARYGSFMEQAGIANGDFAKTINSPANQLRILKAQLRETQQLIGQAFAPITSIVLPILNSLVSGLNACIKAFAMFMSAFFGVEMKMTTSSAIPAAARSIGDVGGNAVAAANAMDGLGRATSRAGEEAAAAVKEFKGLMGFDELNILPSTSSGSGSSGSGGSGGSGGAGGNLDLGGGIEWEKTQEVALEIPKAIQEMADKFKAIAGSIFQPFKDAWEAVGPALIEQIDKAWENIKKIFETAKETISAIWRNGGSDIFQNLIETVLEIGVIAGRVFNETLAPIITGFLDLLNPEKTPGAQAFLDVMKDITDKVKEFVEYLAGDGFYWIDWFVKAFLTFKTVQFVVQMGLATVAIYNQVVAWGVLMLAKLADFMETLAIIGLYIGGFVSSIWGVVTALWAQFTAAMAVNVAMFGLTLPIWAVIAIIAALIAIIVVCVKNWDSIKEAGAKAWEWIKEKWSNAVQWFSDKWNGIKEGASNLWGNLKIIGGNMWEAIKSPFVNAYSWFKTNVVDKITGAFDGMVGIVKGALNGIIDGANWAIGKINSAMTFSIPDWVPLVGGKGFALSIPSIPRLAQGGLVNSGQYYMAGEAGGEVVMPLEHQTQWMTKMADIISPRLNQNMGGNGSDKPIEVVLQVGSTKLGKVVIDSINKVNAQEGRILLNL